jgi:hypothetical protein
VVYNSHYMLQLNHMKNALVYNNVGIIAGPNAIVNGNGGTGAGDTIRNNILSTPPNVNCCSWGVLKDALIEKNIMGADKTPLSGAVLNELFIDATNHDYQLKPTATAAIDQGVDFSPYNDPLVNTPDIGAYEFGKPAWKAGVGTNDFPAPVITPNGGFYQDSIEVSLQNSGSGGVIRYTLDGSDPTGTSKEYVTSFFVSDTAIVKARCFISDIEYSEAASANFYIENMPDLPLRDLENPAGISQGVNYEYYEWNSVLGLDKLPDLETWTPTRTGVTVTIDLSIAHRPDFFMVKFTGFIEIPDDGIYTFFTKSDDNSMLYIGNTLVVSNDFLQGPTERTGRIGLKAGIHALRVDYKENDGNPESVFVSYKGPTISKRFVPANALWHKQYVAQTAKVLITPHGGKYAESVTVKMSCSTPGSQIFYTTDGSTPTINSTPFTQDIILTTYAFYKAVAYSVSMPIPLSVVDSVVFIPSTAPVIISPIGGTFVESATVILSTITPSATIVYTLDGSDPTKNSAVYTEPIKITASGLLKAMAFKVGLAESYIDSASYTIKVSPPVFLPESNTFNNSVMVNISCITPGANIYYAINETPTASSTLYTTPFEINSSCFIKAIAIKPGLTSSTTVKKGLTLVTGIEEIKSDELVVYPNPSDNGNFKIKLPPGLKNEKASLQVTNILGKVVYRETIAAPDNGILDFSEPLKSGCYFINISTTHLNKTIKLIVR